MASCYVHADCGSKLIEVHHNPPLSWARDARLSWIGKTYLLCPNAHLGQVHWGIDEQIRKGKLESQYSPKVILLIREAFALAQQYGYKPVRTL